MKTTLTKRIIPILDSKTIDSKKFDNLPIYDGEIINEIMPPLPPVCFQGAWYRKVFSSKDYWLGIEGTIILGEYIPDPNRFKSDGRIHYKRYLDNPSIYLGGQALRESDAGLGFNVGYETDNTDHDLNYGSNKIAYRPFWRYIYDEIIDENFQVTRTSVNSWNVSDPRNFNYYYFPGDKIKMSIYSPTSNYLQLKIEVLEETTIPKYKKIRDGYKLKKPIEPFYSPIFYSEGHGVEMAEYKRVNAIDQFGNEGFVVSETNASVTNAKWLETYLYRKIDNKIYKVPMNFKRQSQMACPKEGAFSIKKYNETGESISIHPGKTFK